VIKGRFDLTIQLVEQQSGLGRERVRSIHIAGVESCLGSLQVLAQLSGGLQFLIIEYAIDAIQPLFNGGNRIHGLLSQFNGIVGSELADGADAHTGGWGGRS